MEVKNHGVGSRIKEARKGKGLTQKKLGDMIGRTESLIAQYEKGKVEIPISGIENLAEKLGVSANYLLYGNTTFMGFGRRMEGARKIAKLSQQELADILAIPIADLQAYEAGERKPAYELTKKISETLNVGINFLSRGDVTTQNEYDAARLKFGNETWAEKLEDVEGHGEGYLRIRLPGEGEKAISIQATMSAEMRGSIHGTTDKAVILQEAKTSIAADMDKLNYIGAREAAKRIHELTQIDEYTK